MRSIIALPDDYVVIDLETTGSNPQQDSIIEISAVKYRNNTETDRFNQLIAIDQPISSFASMLTGITDEMLKGKPHIQDVLPSFIEFIGNDVLIGHNIAAFDSCFLSKAYDDHLHKEFENPCVDTMRLSKRLNKDFLRHSLHFLAFHYQVSYEGAHRAMADCLITNACFQCMKKEIRESYGEEEFCTATNRKARINVSEIAPECEVTDYNHPFYQKAIVFTGALSLVRQDAMQLAVNVGAIVKTSVTSKTSYLVVGDQDLMRVGDDGLSTKHEKAIALNASGKANIQIIPESEFLKMVKK